MKGDIIYVPFPFSDLLGSKLRPALVLFQNRYEVMVCFITSKVESKINDDLEFLTAKSNGLKKISLIRVSKIMTIDKSLILGTIGKLNSVEINEVNSKLVQVLQLDSD